MTEAERNRSAHEAFRRLLEEFLSLAESKGNGSFTVHFQGHKIRKVKWEVVDDVDQWATATQESTKGAA